MGNFANRQSSLGFALSLLAVLVSACAQTNTGVLVKECVLPSDQSGTLLGKWTLKPVPIAFHQGDFSSSEISAMIAAADTWNNFYGASQGFSMIDYGGSSPRMSSAGRPQNVCGLSPIISGSRFTAPVVIYKDGVLPASFTASQFAVTTGCTTPTTPLKHRISAIIDLNYRDYFVQGRRVPDLQSIVLHEFGHLAGLDHSCESGSTTAGMPNCNAGNSDYVDAVMSPLFGFDASGYGEQKRELTANDEGRANCLYDGQI
jgi:hypothetical protein